MKIVIQRVRQSCVKVSELTSKEDPTTPENWNRKWTSEMNTQNQPNYLIAVDNEIFSIRTKQPKHQHCMLFEFFMSLGSRLPTTVSNPYSISLKSSQVLFEYERGKLNVSFEEEIISSIGRGLLVLVGIASDDTTEDLEFMAKKVLNIRFFESEDQKKWSKNVMDKQYEVLCVSQFTLCQQLKGNRLDFHHAMNPDDSVRFYEKFLNSLKKQYKPEMIKDGKFGAYMQVELCNDGPVTVTLESKSKKNVTESENVDGE